MGEVDIMVTLRAQSHNSIDTHQDSPIQAAREEC